MGCQVVVKRAIMINQSDKQVWQDFSVEQIEMRHRHFDTDRDNRYISRRFDYKE